MPTCGVYLLHSRETGTVKQQHSPLRRVWRAKSRGQPHPLILLPSCTGSRKWGSNFHWDSRKTVAQWHEPINGAKPRHTNQHPQMRLVLHLLEPRWIETISRVWRYLGLINTIRRFQLSRTYLDLCLQLILLKNSISAIREKFLVSVTGSVYFNNSKSIGCLITHPMTALVIQDKSACNLRWNIRT